MSYNRLVGTFRFTLSIEGAPGLADFTEISGLATRVITETIYEGGTNGIPIHLPSSTTYPNLVLKRGIISPELFDWTTEYRDTGIITRKNITVSLLSQDGTTTMQEWHFENAFPVKWNGPSLNASSMQIAIESIEFVHEGIRKGDFYEPGADITKKKWKINRPQFLL